MHLRVLTFMVTYAYRAPGGTTDRHLLDNNNLTLSVDCIRSEDVVKAERGVYSKLQQPTGNACGRLRELVL